MESRKSSDFSIFIDDPGMHYIALSRTLAMTQGTKHSFFLQVATLFHEYNEYKPET